MNDVKQDGTLWEDLSTVPELPPGTIHVWKLLLTNSRDASSRQILSEDEIKKAERFHFKDDRERFIETRSTLRRLLSHYSGLNAAEIVFTYNVYGKPSFLGPNQTETLFFNITHSKDIALFAFCRNEKVGVDIEYMGDTLEYLELAKRFFSKREYLVLAQLTDSELRRGFYRCWTRKEAFVKAVGKGLAFPFADFSVSLEDDAKPQLNCVAHNKSFQGTCKMFPIQIDDSYYASLACLGESERFVCYCCPQNMDTLY